MKSKIAAFIMAGAVLTTVIVNTFILLYNIDEIIGKLEEAPDDISAISEYSEIFDDFKRRERFLSLTVSHSDLSEITYSFAELIAAAKAEDEESFIITKSRLTESLLYLRRHCMISLDSIF